MYPKLIRNRKEWHLGTLPQGCQVDGTGSFEGEIATRKLIESTQSIFDRKIAFLGYANVFLLEQVDALMRYFSAIDYTDTRIPHESELVKLLVLYASKVKSHFC